MQYAEVIIDHKTKGWNDTFSYELTPEILPYIQLGSIVEVPFGNKTVIGIVIKINNSLPRALQGKIKKIKRLLQKNVHISADEIQLAKYLSSKYLASWSESLYSILPEIPKKEVGDNKSILRFSNQEGKKDFLVAGYSDRFSSYLDIIKTNKRLNKTTWIIFPDLVMMKHFITKNRLFLVNQKTASYYSGEQTTIKFKKWLKIRAGQYDVVLGTRLLMLARPTNVGTIIIDEANNSGHQEDQTPTYCTWDLADYWQKIAGVNIQEGDEIISLRQYVQQSKLTINRERDTSVKIIDMNKERQYLSLEAEKIIEKTVNGNKSLLILLMQKGYASKMRCKDCDWEVLCPNCELPLTYWQKTNSLNCRTCGYKQENILVCPNCGSTNLKTYGLGIEKLEEILKRKYHYDYPIITVDKETILNKLSANLIYISTQAIFRYPLVTDFSLIVDGDSFFNRPDFNTDEIAIETFYRVKSRTKFDLLIQSKMPTNEIYKALTTNSLEKFFEEILERRKKENLPPFGFITSLESSNQSEEVAFEKLNTLKKKLNSNNWEIIGPLEKMMPRSKGKYYFQLIIKSGDPIKIDSVYPFLSKEIKIRLNQRSAS